MNFCWSTLNVNNMEESLKFYEEILGLNISQRFETGNGMEIAFLGDGETKIELVCNPGGKAVSVGKDISWGFEVESVDEMMAGLGEKGISVIDGPFQPNPHTKFFFITDPNGLRIQLVEKIG